MPFAALAVTIPDSVWLCALTKANPEAVFRVVSTQHGGETAIGLVEIDADELSTVIAAIERQDDVVDLDLLWTRAGEALVQIETTAPLLLRPVKRAGVPLTTPFEIADGVAFWEFSTSRSKLSHLRSHLETMGIQYRITRVRELDPREDDSLLTDRQRELLLAAADAGYYDTPRETTLTEVAESMDISKATCSNVLHRAEGKLVDRYAARMARSTAAE
ncbi:MAG: helix-turn-helix domain-containing protein [Halobacteriota archaeon]